MPERIQLQRTKGWRLADVSSTAVKVDRTTPFGNPYRVERAESGLWVVLGPWFDVIQLCVSGREDAGAEAVRLFRRLAAENSSYGRELRRAARLQLRGCDLACWCPPDRPCHADVLLEIANAD